MIHINDFGINAIVSTEGLMCVQVDKVSEESRLRIARFIYHNTNVVEFSNEEIDKHHDEFVDHVAELMGLQKISPVGTLTGD